MIGCDEKKCKFQWFHYDCVGLDARSIALDVDLNAFITKGCVFANFLKCIKYWNGMHVFDIELCVRKLPMKGIQKQSYLHIEFLNKCL